MPHSVRKNIVGLNTTYSRSRSSSSAIDGERKADPCDPYVANERNAATTGETRTVRGYTKDLR